MSKRIQANYKIDRRMGENIWGRPKSPAQQPRYGPGSRPAPQGQVSDFGTQLRAKQKAQGLLTANHTEKRSRRYYAASDHACGAIPVRTDWSARAPS